MFQFTKLLYLIFYAYVKNLLNYKLDFKYTTFLVYFTMILPIVVSNVDQTKEKALILLQLPRRR
jgi:hypothetical protein